INFDACVFEVCKERCNKFWLHPKPAHACFNFKMGMQRSTMNVDVFEIILCQFGVEKRHRDAMLDGFRYLGSGGEAQHQQLAGYAGATQGKSLLDTRYANPGCAAS